MRSERHLKDRINVKSEVSPTFACPLVNGTTKNSA